MGLHGGHRVQDHTTATSDMGIAPVVRWVRHACPYTDQPNLGKAWRAKCCNHGRDTSHRKGLSHILCSSLPCCQFCHSSPLARAVVPHKVLLFQPLGISWSISCCLCCGSTVRSAPGHYGGRTHANTPKCAFCPGWSVPMTKKPTQRGDRRWEQSVAWLIYILKSLKCSQKH